MDLLSDIHKGYSLNAYTFMHSPHIPSIPSMTSFIRGYRLLVCTFSFLDITILAYLALSFVTLFVTGNLGHILLHVVHAQSSILSPPKLRIMLTLDLRND